MPDMSTVFNGWTLKQEQDWLAEQLEENRKLEESIALELAGRRASEHFTNCRDCGHFVQKQRWVPRTSHEANKYGQRPLCGKCWDEYDFDY